MSPWTDIKVAIVYPVASCYGISTNLTNCTTHSINLTTPHRSTSSSSLQYLYSARVLCLSSGYRGQKGERGQLGLGLPGDPGVTGPPGKNGTLD